MLVEAVVGAVTLVWSYPARSLLLSSKTKAQPHGLDGLLAGSA